MTEIILTQASGQTTDTPEMVRADVTEALATRPAVLGVTEVGKLSHLKAASLACSLADYKLWRPRNAEVAIALHPACIPISHGAIPAHDGLEGNYEPRYTVGRELAFCLGDTNEPDRGFDGGQIARAFRDARVTTVYDELGLYPGTGPGGGTIDWIASKDRDRRVRATDLHVRRQPNSDHKRVTATYEIQEG